MKFCIFLLEHLQEQQCALYAVLHDQWALFTQMATALKPPQVATTALCEAEIVCITGVSHHH